MNTYYIYNAHTLSPSVFVTDTHPQTTLKHTHTNKLSLTHTHTHTTTQALLLGEDADRLIVEGLTVDLGDRVKGRRSLCTTRLKAEGLLL